MISVYLKTLIHPADLIGADWHNNIRSYQGRAVKTKTTLVNTPRSSQYWSIENFSDCLVLYLVYGSVEGT